MEENDNSKLNKGDISADTSINNEINNNKINNDEINNKEINNNKKNNYEIRITIKKKNKKLFFSFSIIAEILLNTFW